MNTRWVIVGLSLMIASGMGTVAIQIPGTKVDYFAAQDSVTTDNRGMVRIFEVNDTTGETFVRFACEGRVMQAYFHGKNLLLTSRAREMELYPLVVYQVDSQQLKTFKALGTLDENGTPALNSLAFENDEVVVEAFRNAGERVVLRIPRLGMSELTFAFAVKGFREGLSRIKPC